MEANSISDLRQLHLFLLNFTRYNTEDKFISEFIYELINSLTDRTHKTVGERYQ